MTYTGHQAADGAGGVIFSRVELDVAGLCLRFRGGLLKLLGGLSAQLLGLVLDIVDGGVSAVELGAGLPPSGLSGLTIGLLGRDERRREALTDGVLLAVKTDHVARCLSASVS